MFTHEVRVAKLDGNLYSLAFRNEGKYVDHPFMRFGIIWSRFVEVIGDLAVLDTWDYLKLGKNLSDLV